MCSGSCSHSPKWPNSVGRKTVSDMNYGRGRRSADNNECQRITPVQRSNTWSPLAALRPPAAPLSPASGHAHPGIARTQVRNAQAAFTSPGIKFRVCNDPFIDCPSSNLDFKGKNSHIRATKFYNGEDTVCVCVTTSAGKLGALVPAWIWG